MDSRSLFLTANTENIYALAWLDLRDGPVVVESPPNVLGLVDDFWFHYVTDIGQRRTRRRQGRQLPVPAARTTTGDAARDGYHVYQSRTFGNIVGLRGFLVNGDPGPTVESIKEQLRIYPARRGRPTRRR